MRWKNGGGETAEIAVSPPGAALDAFDWRLSMARVETDGPFSAFPGIDRTLVILEGEGIRLAVGSGAPVTLTRESPPHAFAADVQTTADLVAGPVVDLNFMARRDRVGHMLTRLRLDDSVEVERTGETVIFCAEGAVTFSASHDSTELAVYDALVWSTGGKALLQALRRSLIYLVNIERG